MGEAWRRCGKFGITPTRSYLCRLRRKGKERGYNQSAELAKVLSEKRV
ncbi:MAG: hypothetical protein ACLS4Z_01375 [Christensenellaceae bacterium]